MNPPASYTGAERRHDGERLSVLEERLTAVKDELHDHRKDVRDRLDGIDKKLDDALACKADKTEVADVSKTVEKLDARFWALLISTGGVAVLTLIGIAVFLLQNHIH